VRGSPLLSHSLCECELLFAEPGFDELDRAEPAMCAVRPVDVVVDPPVLREHFGLEQGVEVTGDPISGVKTNPASHSWRTTSRGRSDHLGRYGERT
jgi:hypothetical protein